MEVNILNSNKSMQTQKLNDASSDPVKKITTEETSQYAQKNQVDTSEISASHSGSFEDKKLMIAKSAILYDVTVGTSPNSRGIEELKTAVQNGTYEVPAEDIADAIIFRK